MAPSGPTLAASDRVRRVPDLMAATVDGELVMMDVQRGVYFGLDAIGSSIWARLEVPASAEELAAEFARDYDADIATIEADVLALFRRLLDRGLVEIM